MANQSRRKFMRNSLFGMAALPLGATLRSKHAFAQELAPLDPERPQAQARNYVKVAADGSAHPGYVEGHNCASCMCFQEGNNGCQLFPGSPLETAGWCQPSVQNP